MCKYLFDLQIYLCKYEYYLFYSYLRKYYLFTALNIISHAPERFHNLNPSFCQRHVELHVHFHRAVSRRCPLGR